MSSCMQESGSVLGRLQLTANNLRWYSAHLYITAELTTLTELIYNHTWITGILFVILVVTSLDVLMVFFFVIYKRNLIWAHVTHLLGIASTPSAGTNIQTLTAADGDDAMVGGPLNLPRISGPELVTERGITCTPGAAITPAS